MSYCCRTNCRFIFLTGVISFRFEMCSKCYVDREGEYHSLVAPPEPAGRVRLATYYDVETEILKVTVECAE